MIILNFKSASPIWEQLCDAFKKQILTGILQPGDKLPSVRALAGELGVNPNTIQRSMSVLESEGFIYTVAGKGCFVAEKNEGPLIAEQLKRIEEFIRALNLVREAGVERHRLEEIIEKEYNK